MRSLSGRSPSAALSTQHSALSTGEREDQLAFDWTFGHTHCLLLVSEVAEIFRVSDQAIRSRCDEGRLIAFPINAAAEPHREHLRILRKSAEHGIAGEQLTASAIADLIKSADTWLIRHSRQTLTVSDVVNALRITGEHVRQLFNQGHLEAFNAGRVDALAQTLRFHRSSLVQFVQRRLAAKNNIQL